MAIENSQLPVSVAQKDIEEDFTILELILRNYLTDENIVRVRKAFTFAQNAHQGQLRANGEPYIIHPVMVAEILAEYQLDAETIMAGLLHDIIEDTELGFETLENEFGVNVANLVQGVTNVSQIGGQNQREGEIDNFRCMLVATAKDLHVIIIKLADRLHNMRTLESTLR